MTTEQTVGESIYSRSTLPEFKCHKRVKAARIVEIVGHATLSVDLYLDNGLDPIGVTPEWFGKHCPQIGGYFVLYADGYQSYSPCGAFEEGYLKACPMFTNGETEANAPTTQGNEIVWEQPLPESRATNSAIEQEIQAKGLTAPRVTLADLEANIATVEIVKQVTIGGQVLRWAVITTQSGFAVTGKPSCSVSPENDNAEIGERLAKANATSELWGMMGYALKQKLFESINRAQGGEDTFKTRLLTEYSQLQQRTEKLEAFISTAAFEELPKIDRDDLRAQLDHMKQYFKVLSQRVSRQCNNA